MPTYNEQAADTMEQSDNDNHQNERVQLADVIPTSSLQINLGFQSFLLEEVVLDEQEDEQVSTRDILVQSSQKALKVLFRRIISPNAP